jgi:hypothetical protein
MPIAKRSRVYQTRLTGHFRCAGTYLINLTLQDMAYKPIRELQMSSKEEKTISFCKGHIKKMEECGILLWKG